MVKNTTCLAQTIARNSTSRCTGVKTGPHKNEADRIPRKKMRQAVECAATTRLDLMST